MKRCTKCNGRVISDFIDYEAILLNQKVTIEKVDGFRCLECGNVEVDDSVKEGLKDKLLEKKLEIQKEVIKGFRPLLVNNIKKVRESKRISRKILGEALGYSEQRFGAIERNDNTPIITTAVQIANALEVSVDEIYTIVNVSVEFYDKIKNLRKVEQRFPDGTVKIVGFETIDTLIPHNEKYTAKEQEVLEKMAKARKIKKQNEDWQKKRKLTKIIKDLKNEPEPNEAIKSMLAEAERELAVVQNSKSVKRIDAMDDEIKSLKKIKNSLLKTKRDVENESKCVLKQSQCIEGEVYEILKEKFSKDFYTL